MIWELNVKEGTKFPIDEDTLIEKLSHKKEIGFDTETTGDFEDPFNRKVVMIQLGDEDSQFVIDCRKIPPLKILSRLVE